MNKLHSADVLRERVGDGLKSLEIDLLSGAIDNLVRYVDLLDEWNGTYNLTAVRGTGKMISHHILDSLSVLPYLQGKHCADIGTGAGLPGLVLAIAEPERQWVLIDSNQKKIRFVRYAMQTLDICNAEAICQRVEQFHPEIPFSTIVTRAYGNIGKIIRDTAHLVPAGCRILAMKGPKVTAELQKLGNCTEKIQILSHTLHVPGLSEDRRLVEICPITVTN